MPFTVRNKYLRCILFIFLGPHLWPLGSKEWPGVLIHRRVLAMFTALAVIRYHIATTAYSFVTVTSLRSLEYGSRDALLCSLVF